MDACISHDDASAIMYALLDMCYIDVDEAFTGGAPLNDRVRMGRDRIMQTLMKKYKTTSTAQLENQFKKLFCSYQNCRSKSYPSITNSSNSNTNTNTNSCIVESSRKNPFELLDPLVLQTVAENLNVENLKTLKATAAMFRAVCDPLIVKKISVFNECIWNALKGVYLESQNYKNIVSISFHARVNSLGPNPQKHTAQVILRLKDLQDQIGQNKKHLGIYIESQYKFITFQLEDGMLGSFDEFKRQIGVKVTDALITDLLGGEVTKIKFDGVTDDDGNTKHYKPISKIVSSINKALKRKKFPIMEVEEAKDVKNGQRGGSCKRTPAKVMYAGRVKTVFVGPRGGKKIKR